MRNSISDRSLFIDSEDDDDEGKPYDGNDSDSSNDSDHSHRSKPNSITTAWPQSYRQSIDLYGSVPSPSLNFLGPSSLSRLGSSFLSSSFTRRHTPEILPSLNKPLLQPHDDPPPQQRKSSHTLVPSFPSKKSGILKSGRKRSKISHELPVSRRSSYGQAVLNGINVLCGVGILSTPYAVKEGGWLGLSILFVFGVVSLYTGFLLRYCLDSQPGMETYPDIGQAAFGTKGRIGLSIILYVELYAACVEYLILESDNLSALFPNAHLNLGAFVLDSHHVCILVATLAILPTVWLRDLSILSYISAGGVVSSILVVISLFWVGLVDQVGFQPGRTVLDLQNVPVAIGLYGFCYSGHAVFPNIYTSMEKPNQYTAVLFTSFGLCTFMYAGVAVMGYMMFGDSTKSQFTLNMPQDLVASKIAVWTTVVNPFSKFALTLSPVAMSLEELIPSSCSKSNIYSVLIRTALVLSTLVVALSVPFFGLVMALIGSLLTMLVALIIPCACFLSIMKGKVSIFQATLCILVIAVGIVAACVGTYSALTKIIQSYG